MTATVDGALATQAPVKAQVRSWKAPIALAIFTVLYALLILAAPRGGETTFRISTQADAIQLPEITVSVGVTTWVVFGLLVLLTVFSAVLVRAFRQTPLWLIAAYIIIAIVGFLTWAAAGETIPVAGLLAGAVALAIPLIYGALAGVIGERAGVVNIAIEGQLLAGAFSAAVVASVTGQPLLGLVAAMFAGMLVAFVLAAFAIKYLVDQVIIGVVLNVLVIGLTSFFYSQVLQPNQALLNSPPRFTRIPIPILSDIPVIGPVLFRQTIIVYLMYIAVAVVWFGMFRTRWGLRLRAVGEHPQAADTVGIKVNPTRFWNVLARRRHRRPRRHRLHDRQRHRLQQGDDRRRRLHRAGRRHLRTVGSVQGHAGRTPVRLRVQPAEHAQRDRLAGAERVHADAALPRHDLRGRRSRRTLPGSGRRRPAVHKGMTPAVPARPARHPLMNCIYRPEDAQ